MKCHRLIATKAEQAVCVAHNMIRDNVSDVDKKVESKE